MFSFRQGPAEHKVTLHYGGGPDRLSIGDREFGFAYADHDDGGFVLTMNGARRVCSIFITSRVRMAAPFSSVAPCSANSATTVPGNGATILSSPTCSSSSPPNGSTQCRSKRPLRVRR